LSSDAAFIDYWQYKRGTVYSNSQFAQFQHVDIEILQVPEKNIRNPNKKRSEENFINRDCMIYAPQRVLLR
jgi:hypothetical protein